MTTERSVVLIERRPGLTDWIPLIVGGTAFAGTLFAVERARIAVVKRRTETGE